jgi:hypothetical protein
MDEDIRDELTEIQKKSVNIDLLKEVSRITTLDNKHISEIISISSRSHDKRAMACTVYRYYRLLNGLK